jgi:aminoglycoside phosphotransferase
MTSVIKDPIRIFVPCKNSDLTPDEVLRNLETGVNLNTFDTGTSVKLIFGDKVVKYGGSVRAAEAYNMEYVKKRTRINIPAVLLAFYHAGRTYIVMDYVRGHTLQDKWTSASKNQQLAWASQLAEIISQLRALPSMDCTRPGPLNPSMEERCEGRWFTNFGAGPFHSHHDLAKWLNKKLSIARRGCEDETSTYPVFESTCRLVFTHQDLAARNLIVDDNGRLWAIDWELAGWYPEYIEYACIASDTGAPKLPVPQGWKETVLSYLQSYKREYEMLQSLRWVLDVLPFS